MVSISSESVAKMEDEVSSLLHLFNSFKMAGKSATLVLSTKGGKTTTAKLEVELSNTKAEGAEGRHRPQPSAAKRARANARAAQHRVHQALPFPGGDYGAAVGPPHCPPPPPRPPLRVHPSPTCENRRRTVTLLDLKEKHETEWKRYQQNMERMKKIVENYKSELDKARKDLKKFKENKQVKVT